MPRPTEGNRLQITRVQYIPLSGWLKPKDELDHIGLSSVDNPVKHGRPSKQ